MLLVCQPVCQLVDFLPVAPVQRSSGIPDKFLLLYGQLRRIHYRMQGKYLPHYDPLLRKVSVRIQNRYLQLYVLLTGKVWHCRLYIRQLLYGLLHHSHCHIQDRFRLLCVLQHRIHYHIQDRFRLLYVLLYHR